MFFTVVCQGILFVCFSMFPYLGIGFIDKIFGYRQGIGLTYSSIFWHLKISDGHQLRKQYLVNKQ
jgi:hypothetical protein